MGAHPPLLAGPVLGSVGAQMEPLPPAGASALCQLGPRVGEGERLFLQTPSSLGSGRGLSGVNPCCPREKMGLKEPNQPPPPKASPTGYLWLWPGWGSQMSTSSWLLPSLALGQTEVGSLKGSVCSVSTPAGISPSTLWSLSPGKRSRASPYRNCECGSFQGQGQQVCECVCVLCGPSSACTSL